MKGDTHDFAGREDFHAGGPQFSAASGAWSNNLRLPRETIKSGEANRAGEWSGKHKTQKIPIL